MRKALLAFALLISCSDIYPTNKCITNTDTYSCPPDAPDAGNSLADQGFLCGDPTHLCRYTENFISMPVANVSSNTTWYGIGGMTKVMPMMSYKFVAIVGSNNANAPTAAYFSYQDPPLSSFFAKLIPSDIYNGKIPPSLRNVFINSNLIAMMTGEANFIYRYQLTPAMSLTPNPISNSMDSVVHGLWGGGLEPGKETTIARSLSMTDQLGTLVNCSNTGMCSSFILMTTDMTPYTAVWGVASPGGGAVPLTQILAASATGLSLFPQAKGPYPVPTNYHSYGVAVSVLSGSNEWWVAGGGSNESTILHGYFNPNFHVDSIQFPDLKNISFYGVWAGPKDVWFVGSQGTILNYEINSKKWSLVSMPMPVTSDLHGVWSFNNDVTATQDVWIVGDNNTVLHR